MAESSDQGGLLPSPPTRTFAFAPSLRRPAAQPQATLVGRGSKAKSDSRNYDACEDESVPSDSNSSADDERGGGLFYRGAPEGDDPISLVVHRGAGGGGEDRDPRDASSDSNSDGDCCSGDDKTSASMHEATSSEERLERAVSAAVAGCSNKDSGEGKACWSLDILEEVLGNSKTFRQFQERLKAQGMTTEEVRLTACIAMRLRDDGGHSPYEDVFLPSGTANGRLRFISCEGRHMYYKPELSQWVLSEVSWSEKGWQRLKLERAVRGTGDLPPPAAAWQAVGHQSSGRASRRFSMNSQNGRGGEEAPELWLHAASDVSLLHLAAAMGLHSAVKSLAPTLAAHRDSSGWSAWEYARHFGRPLSGSCLRSLLPELGEDERATAALLALRCSLKAAGSTKGDGGGAHGPSPRSSPNDAAVADEDCEWELTLKLLHEVQVDVVVVRGAGEERVDGVYLPIIDAPRKPKRHAKEEHHTLGSFENAANALYLICESRYVAGTWSIAWTSDPTHVVYEAASSTSGPHAKLPPSAGWTISAGGKLADSPPPGLSVREKASLLHVAAALGASAAVVLLAGLRSAPQLAALQDAGGMTPLEYSACCKSGLDAAAWRTLVPEHSMADSPLWTSWPGIWRWLLINLRSPQKLPSACLQAGGLEALVLSSAVSRRCGDCNGIYLKYCERHGKAAYALCKSSAAHVDYAIFWDGAKWGLYQHWSDPEIVEYDEWRLLFQADVTPDSSSAPTPPSNGWYAASSSLRLNREAETSDSETSQSSSSLSENHEDDAKGDTFHAPGANASTLRRLLRKNKDDDSTSHGSTSDRSRDRDASKPTYLDLPVHSLRNLQGIGDTPLTKPAA
eukprot:TRINITY_DN19231_c0_g2_i1.p1 TRINITY_DN19231_c0_g2~~TRINITY_DN19231_c0_g2_i1.p1  ORF type:complete len:889 (-),score=171.43 TRINITY_DN19231_c0_g2_i1:102-2651(-)